jgi:16S rRNA (uracil1498-N3)-methyltransferase
MNQFFVDDKNIMETSIYITDKDDIKHITKVLRLVPGDQVEVSDGHWFEYRTKIVTIVSNSVELNILEKQALAREPILKVFLYQALPKQGKMETIIQKAVELGVYSVTPIFTRRSIITDKGNNSSKTERWQKVADEAAKQCKRGRIPTVEVPLSFKQMLEVIRKQDYILFPYENESKRTIKHAINNLINKPDTIAVIIGPEGGFSDEEAEALLNIGAVSASLGKTILRTETAGAAALAMIFYALEL